MADSYFVTVAPGGQAIFGVPFPYINKAHVMVSLNGVQQLLPADYVWVTDGSISFFGAPFAGVTVKIWRSTSPDGPLVQYQNGATLTADDLNVAVLQALYRTQELQDALDSFINGGIASYEINGSNAGLSPEELIAQAAANVLNSALLADLNTRIADISANAQSILNQTSRVDTLQSTVDALANINGTGIATYLVNETNQRISGDTALAQLISLIGAQNGANNAFILDMSTVQVDSTTSLGDRLAGIIASVGANTSAITSETTARTTAVSALSTQVSNLSATVTSNNTTLNAAIGNEQTARANADSAEATARQALAATVASNGAAITSEQTARASGDSANASSINSLTTTVNGNTASIQSSATSINGLQAQYTVKVDVNGRVAGFGLASTAVNGATVSDFIILANRFSIVDPGNGLSAPTVPFTVQGGVVYMNSVVIKDALIQNMTITKLTQGSLNADMSIGTGRIIWDNGSFMKVIGVGFGSSNQFLEWSGPHKSNPSLCSESDATQYLRVDGSAYFGGALLAGKLFNSTQGTNLTSANVADLGPFASNGNAITITWSWLESGLINYPATTTGDNQYNAIAKVTPTGTVVLSRSLNGAPFVDIATLNVTGSHSEREPVVADGSPGFYKQGMSGSSTYLDPDHLAQPREYRLRITAWNNVNATVNTNTLSIQSLE